MRERGGEIGRERKRKRERERERERERFKMNVLRSPELQLSFHDHFRTIS